MSIFSFDDKLSIGNVYSVDTASAIIKISDLENLKRIQVNHLVCLRSAKPGQHLIGLITKITRNILGHDVNDDDGVNVILNTENLIKVILIGTLHDTLGLKSNVFRRTLECVPEIDALCFLLEKEYLSHFMNAISQVKDGAKALSLGKYTMDDEAEAFIDGNKLFQRHAVIVGSTGSGKSWSVAKLLEQSATLPNVNAILFDLHGEYSTLRGNGFQHLRIAGPIDSFKENSLEEKIIFLPYWLLTYEEIISMLLDRSDQNAPNQAMLFSRSIYKYKSEYLNMIGKEDIQANFTIDSPIPYSIDDVLKELENLNSEMVPGARGERQGDFHGKLSRFLQRLEAKKKDKRLTFLFGCNTNKESYSWFNSLCNLLMSGSSNNEGGGIKIIDFSEVPSDILPLIIGLVARIIFSVQQWCKKDKRHPISIFCDEAHLYIPERFTDNNLIEQGYRSFERIAKEGRKYGVSLVIISQRPSEVNRTVLSQCNNFISMKLSNADDQTVIRKLLPDNLSGVTAIFFLFWILGKLLSLVMHLFFLVELELTNHCTNRRVQQ